MQLTPRDKRLLQIMAGVVPVLLLFYLFVLKGGGEEAALPELPTGSSGPVVVPTVTPSPTPRETLPPVELAGERDPFSIPPGLQSASGSVSPPVTGSVSPTSTVSPTTTTTTPPPTSPPPTSPPPTSPPPTSPPPPPPDDGQADDHILIGGHDVTLLTVFHNKTTLQVEVDGKLYTVEEGATFDDNFKLVKIDGGCAKFLFGDQSFELCEQKG